MRQQIFYLFLVLLLSASCGNKTVANSNSDGFSGILSPDIPDKITFAGETVTFDRYDLRERLDRELINFCYMHSNTLLTMKRANRYLPEIEKILEEEGIPDDFKYLMIIESNANQLALSAAGAAGLWQFMESTAQEYGLEINQWVDERYNITLATHAACKYLRKSYEINNSWLTAAASYNAGKNKIEKELAEQLAENVLDLYLNSETSRYIFRIIAAKIIFDNPVKYGFQINTNQLYPPFEYETKIVSTSIENLPEWAEENSITYAQLKELNPWLRKKELTNKTGKKYEIRIPEKKSMFYNIDDIVNNLPCKL